jgi:hypothetical protein
VDGQGATVGAGVPNRHKGLAAFGVDEEACVRVQARSRDHKALVQVNSLL